MERNRTLASQRFETALNECMIKKFGRRISAQHFANQYNLRAHGTSTISRETARKWMRGGTIPEFGKLAVLVQWLDLDLFEFIEAASGTPKQHEQKSNENIALKIDGRSADLLKILSELDPKSAETLMLTAWALKKSQQGSSTFGTDVFNSNQDNPARFLETWLIKKNTHE